MPKRAKRVCNKPGCSVLITNASYCKNHSRHIEYNKQVRYVKDKKYSDFYSSKAWIKVRDNILKRDLYLCKRCSTFEAPKLADVVHHKIELKDNWDLRFEPSNLESLCHGCHNKHHAKGGGLNG